MQPTHLVCSTLHEKREYRVWVLISSETSILAIIFPKNMYIGFGSTLTHKYAFKPNSKFGS
jgi:hypothetical protein